MRASMRSVSWIARKRFLPAVHQALSVHARYGFYAACAAAQSRSYKSDQSRESAFKPFLATLAAAAGGAAVLAHNTSPWQPSCRQRACHCEEVSKWKRSPSISFSTDKDTQQLVLAADCGGTNTRLMLYIVDPAEPILEKHAPPGRLLKEVKYPNVLYKSLDAIIQTFLRDECQCGTEIGIPVVAVLAVAGVVANNTVRYTNLDWVVSGYELQRTLQIPRVEVINDFVAQGYGALTLTDDEVICANDAKPVAGAPIACIGAGTGLGECFLVADDAGNYRCYPSEGGHSEFAPRGLGIDDLQIRLLKHLKVKFSGFNRISVERVVSGKGICNVYEFLAYHHPTQIRRDIHLQFQKDPMNAGIIAKNADPGTLCEKAMQIFASCYGSQVGTLALHFMPYKGLYITGGVTQKSLDFLQRDNSFLDAYYDKGRVSPLLHRVPLYFVKSDDMGQRGAHYRAVQLLKAHNEGHVSRVEQFEDFDVEALPAPRNLDTKSIDNAKEFLNALAAFDKRAQNERRNRRLPIPPGLEDQYEPIFKGTLYKVLKIGSRENKDDWIKRTMWISKNGALVYKSEEEGRNLIYWTPEDLHSAFVSEVSADAAVMPFVFRVQPISASGATFASSEFAAESEEARAAWIAKIKKFQAMPRARKKE